MTTKWQDFHPQTPPTVEHQGPPSQFRVIACDTFEGPFADYLVGDFAELDAAIAAAKGALSPMMAVYVYDETGRLEFNEFQPSEVGKRKPSGAAQEKKQLRMVLVTHSLHHFRFGSGICSWRPEHGQPRLGIGSDSLECSASPGQDARAIGVGSKIKEIPAGTKVCFIVSPVEATVPTLAVE